MTRAYINIPVNIPVAPILIWIELHTGWTWIIDIFVLLSMLGYLWVWFLGWCTFRRGWKN